MPRLGDGGGRGVLVRVKFFRTTWPEVKVYVCGVLDRILSVTSKNKGDPDLAPGRDLRKIRFLIANKG